MVSSAGRPAISALDENARLLADLLKNLLEIPQDDHFHLHLLGQVSQRRAHQGFILRQEALHLRLVSQHRAEFHRQHGILSHNRFHDPLVGNQVAGGPVAFQSPVIGQGAGPDDGGDPIVGDGPDLVIVVAHAGYVKDPLLACGNHGVQINARHVRTCLCLLVNACSKCRLPTQNSFNASGEINTV
jgi:hypothetical protein